MTPPTKRRLKCACCGDDAGRYRQWPNQDTGWGICRRCVDYLMTKEYTDADIQHLYGVEGTHFEGKKA